MDIGTIIETHTNVPMELPELIPLPDGWGVKSDEPVLEPIQVPEKVDA